MTKIFKAILPTNYPKLELNHILIDEKNIVATNTMILIIKPHNLEVTEKMLIINDKAKLKITAEGIFIGEKINKTIASSYPDYKRIISKYESSALEDTLEEDSKLKNTFINSLYKITAKHGIMFDYVNFATRFRNIDKEFGICETYNFQAVNSSIQLTSKNGIKIILMPFLF